ncbi:crcB protein (plasmid) [Deinococcus geothermalis DSM 11300]|uniref:Fluoride-specific ion channel FluC 2 n=1 Tax=Deinococcus geothermalis (strain DSM 11300 / CIP 105573 / AG-3a) TaxID=319795 RepID=FLUC2_DEIGD|nr:fluoride efflux transporter CrcB [Deinococcus geothermalis]Q1J3F4.1 RecName: Full=Fluoride-specific ion channel FluC 2 [Deinococcus geothermalis DSM 11300]ABF43980.1 crcB protein [Deinococcus geothermalis DSM 11300]
MPFWFGVAVGGALGALARYGVSLLVAGRLASTAWGNFPLATLLVNVLGSFLLAFITTLALRGLVSPAWRLAVGTGFIGALTTFSTFAWESDLMVRDGEAARASLYVLGNLVLGYAAVLLGRALAARLGGGA